jgi:hypothetical protein
MIFLGFLVPEPVTRCGLSAEILLREPEVENLIRFAGNPCSQSAAADEFGNEK